MFYYFGNVENKTTSYVPQIYKQQNNNKKEK